MAVRQKRQGRLFDKEMMWKKKKRMQQRGSRFSLNVSKKKKKTLAHTIRRFKKRMLLATLDSRERKKGSEEACGSAASITYPSCGASLSSVFSSFFF